MHVSGFKKIFYLYIVFVVFFYAIIGFFLPGSITTRADVPGIFKAIRDLVFALIVYLFFLRFFLEGNKLQIAPKLFWLISFYIVYVFIQSFRFYMRGDVTLFALVLANRNALEYILLLFIMQSLIKSKADLIRLINFMIVLFIVLALIGILQFKLGSSNRFYSLADESGARFRASGTLNNPSTFGLSVSLGIILLITSVRRFGRSAAHKKGLVICLFPVILMIFTFIYSRSLTSVIGLLTGLACLFLLQKKARYVFVFFLVAGISSYALSDKAISVVNFSSPSFLIRLGLWKTAIPKILQSPLVGYGTGTYGATAGTLGINQITDNYYLSLLLQQGIIGFTVFCLIVGGILVKTLSLLRVERDSEVKNVVISLFACVIALLIASISGDFLEGFPINIWFWLFLGILLRYPYIRCGGGALSGRHTTLN